MIYKRLFYLTLLVLALFLVLAAAPVLVRERISIDSPEDSYVFNGSDIIWYADLHDTETARVEGATGDITTVGDLTVGGTANFSDATVIGVTTSTLAAQTTGALTVTGASILSGTVDVLSALDMNGEAINNIGAAGTDFSATGGLTLADDLNMSNQPIVNIGNAGTDFGTDGGLTLAAGLTVGGVMVLPQQTEEITAGFTITPTATYVVLISDGAYTSDTSVPLATTGMITGQLVIIRNGNASDALTIDGTGGTVECKTDRVLGASDIQSLIFNGSEWNCIAAVADNS